MFPGMRCAEKATAFSSYAEKLSPMALALGVDHNETKALLIHGLELLITGDVGRAMIQAQLVGVVTEAATPAWMNHNPDSILHKRRLKMLASLFQDTQVNYLTRYGQTQALLGLRMLGQAGTPGTANPFLLAEPETRDAAIYRMAFFLRLATLRTHVKKSLASGKVKQDLLNAWQHCARALYQRVQHQAWTDNDDQQRHSLIQTLGLLAHSNPSGVSQSLATLPGDILEDLHGAGNVDAHVQAGLSMIKRARLGCDPLPAPHGPIQPRKL
jgi:hypothetical protein